MTGISVYPACTRLDSGGCCSHPLLSCQPSTVETIVRDVLVIDTINLSDKMVSVNLTRHLSCGCECRVQEHHCNHLQTYVPDECRCECTNTNQRDLCLQDETKLWDESSCTCGCRYAHTECSTGMRFDLESCRCVYFDIYDPNSTRPPLHGRPYTKGKYRKKLTYVNVFKIYGVHDLSKNSKK